MGTVTELNLHKKRSRDKDWEKRYQFDEQLEVSKIASEHMETFLKGVPSTLTVVNVEDDKRYQKKDVDLLWMYLHEGKELVKKVEVKGDTYSDSPNFFVETISNMDKNTPGCFMYTEADYIFYYFVEKRELTIINMKKFRAWFDSNKSRFRTVNLKTEVSGSYYRTEGKLVPKEVLWAEIGARKLDLDENFKIA